MQGSCRKTPEENCFPSAEGVFCLEFLSSNLQSYWDSTVVFSLAKNLQVPGADFVQSAAQVSAGLSRPDVSRRARAGSIATCQTLLVGAPLFVVQVGTYFLSKAWYHKASDIIRCQSRIGIVLWREVSRSIHSFGNRPIVCSFRTQLAPWTYFQSQAARLEVKQCEPCRPTETRAWSLRLGLARHLPSRQSWWWSPPLLLPLWQSQWRGLRPLLHLLRNLWKTSSQSLRFRVSCT